MNTKQEKLEEARIKIMDKCACIGQDRGKLLYEIFEKLTKSPCECEMTINIGVPIKITSKYWEDDRGESFWQEVTVMNDVFEVIYELKDMNKRVKKPLLIEEYSLPLV